MTSSEVPFPPSSLPQEQPALSVVIPSYNEAERLAASFAQLDAWLAAPSAAPVEVLLVDDGSQDRTLALLEAFAAERDCVRVLAEPHRGKAATVRAGILAARGDLILFSDADFSAPLSEARHLVAAAREGAQVVIGSREAVGSKREGEPFYRHFMGKGFNLLTRTLVPGVRDTQCGFKLFTREAAQAIFTDLPSGRGGEIEGPMVTAFDVEVLFLARRLGFSIREVPVRWVYAEGSKVSALRDAYRMALDVAKIHVGSWRGVYPKDLDGSSRS
ncbi:MAG: glycosyltransferase family 2 protein [Planctomycetes bacterium]|nr:glycosyltransferase family 2 protein [Planctomycetota bacterium]